MRHDRWCFRSPSLRRPHSVPFDNLAIGITSAFPSKRCLRTRLWGATMSATFAECADNARQCKLNASKTKSVEEWKYSGSNELPDRSD
jgi:hypothetical protein